MKKIVLIMGCLIATSTTPGTIFSLFKYSGTVYLSSGYVLYLDSKWSKKLDQNSSNRTAGQAAEESEWDSMKLFLMAPFTYKDEIVTTIKEAQRQARERTNHK